MKNKDLYQTLLIMTYACLIALFTIACIQDTTPTTDPNQSNDAQVSPMQDAQVNCLAQPICMNYFEEVSTCEGKEHCYRNTLCGQTIFCQMRPECVGFVEDQVDQTDSQSDQASEKPAPEAPGSGAPLPDVAPRPDPSRIDECMPNFLSNQYCDVLEIENRTCFAYVENHPCFGSTLQYCRPIYPEGLDCAMLLECNAGYFETDACYVGDANCYTLNTCGGTIFCSN